MAGLGHNQSDPVALSMAGLALPHISPARGALSSYSIHQGGR